MIVLAIIGWILAFSFASIFMAYVYREQKAMVVVREVIRDLSQKANVDSTELIHRWGLDQI